MEKELDFWFKFVGVGKATKTVMFKLIPLNSYADLSLNNVYNFLSKFKPIPEIKFKVTAQKEKRGELLIITEPKLACLLMSIMEEKLKNSEYQKGNWKTKNYFSNVIEEINDSFDSSVFGYRRD